MAESKYGKYVVTDLIIPEEKKRIAADYARYATRILWMDENVAPGAFHMNTAWYSKPPPLWRISPTFTTPMKSSGFSETMRASRMTWEEK